MYAVLSGYTPSLKASDRRECVGLFTVRGVVQMIYGYPNEEAYWHDPRGDLSHGASEIVGSPWSESINSYNATTFGSSYIEGEPTLFRHFFVGSKDSSAQFLARDLTLDLFEEPTLLAAYRKAVEDALRRLDSYPEP